MRFVGTEQSKDYIYKRVLALFDKFGIKSANIWPDKQLLFQASDQYSSVYFSTKE